VVTLGASEAALAGRIVMVRAVVKQILVEAGKKIVAAVRKAIGEYAVKKAADMAQDLAKETAKSLGKAIGSQLTQLSLGAGMDGQALLAGAVNPALTTFTGTKWDDEDGDGKYGLEADGVGKVVSGTVKAGEAIAKGDAGDAWDGYQEAVSGARSGIGSRYEEPGGTTATTTTTEPSGPGEGGGPTSGGDGGSPSGNEGGESGSGTGGGTVSGSGGESGPGADSPGEGSSGGGPAARPTNSSSDTTEDDNVRAAFG
jgi:hypothetical protein